MTNTESAAPTSQPAAHTPQVGQARRLSGAAGTIKILDEGSQNTGRLQYLCRYENGEEAWYPLLVVDAISSYADGPEERDLDVILANRIDRAMVALPRSPALDDYAARHILKAAENTLAKKLMFPGESLPRLTTEGMIAILDLVECYQRRIPGGVDCPQPKRDSVTYSFTSKTGDLCTAGEALASVEKAVKNAQAERDANDKARIDAAVAHLSQAFDKLRMSQADVRVVGVPESTVSAPGRVLSMTLGSTIPDRDTLAMDWIDRNGGGRMSEIIADPTFAAQWLSELASLAYDFADVMIRASAEVPADVKAIQVGPAPTGVESTPESMLHATPIDLDGLRKFFKREEMMAKYGQCLTTESADGKTGNVHLVPTQAKLDESGADAVFIDDLRTAARALSEFGWTVTIDRVHDDGKALREVAHRVGTQGPRFQYGPVPAEEERPRADYMKALEDLVSPVALHGEGELQTVKRLVQEQLARDADGKTAPAPGAPSRNWASEAETAFDDYKLAMDALVAPVAIYGESTLATVKRLAKERDATAAQHLSDYETIVGTLSSIRRSNESPIDVVVRLARDAGRDLEVAANPKYRPDPWGFLVDSGLLFEINRTILHPLGMAIAMCNQPAEAWPNSFYGLQWVKDDPEGIYFGTQGLQEGAVKLALYMAREGAARHAARKAALGYVIEGAPSDTERALADYRKHEDIDRPGRMDLNDALRAAGYNGNGLLMAESAKMIRGLLAACRADDAQRTRILANVALCHAWLSDINKLTAGLGAGETVNMDKLRRDLAAAMACLETLPFTPHVDKATTGSAGVAVDVAAVESPTNDIAAKPSFKWSHLDLNEHLKNRSHCVASLGEYRAVGYVEVNYRGRPCFGNALGGEVVIECPGTAQTEDAETQAKRWVEGQLTAKLVELARTPKATT